MFMSKISMIKQTYLHIWFTRNSFVIINLHLLIELPIAPLEKKLSQRTWPCLIEQAKHTCEVFFLTDS